MPFLDIPSGRIFYTEYKPSDPPRSILLLHHGLGSTQNYYRSITPALSSAPHNFHCITYDAISSGLSSLATSAQSMDTLAQDAIAVLDALGVKEKVVFVGNSMAGMLAAVIAAKYGERFKASVALGPVLPGANVKETFDARVKLIEKEGMEAVANVIPERATGERATPLIHAFIRTLLLSQNPEGYINICKVVGGAAVPDYEKIEMPTLLIAGSMDTSAPLAGCEEIYRRTGGRKNIKIVEGMGHWHCIEEPGKTAGFIGDFVENVIKDS